MKRYPTIFMVCALIGILFLFGAQAKTIALPDSLTHIGEEAFSENDSVSTLVIHENVALDSRAFLDCPNLRVLVFEGDGHEFPDDAFEGCPLEAVYCNEDTYAFLFAERKGLQIYPLESFANEWDYAFRVLKDGTASITGYKGTDMIVTVPGYVRGIKVTEIADNAFRGNRSVNEIILPESIEKIGNGAFTDCAFLKKINIPAGVREIGDNPFVNCSALDEFMLSEDNPVFSVENGVLMSRPQKRAIYFSCSSSVTSVTIPEGIEVIGKNAFRRASSLGKIVFPDSLRAIEDYAFFECAQLKSASLPFSIRTIGDYAFAGCIRLLGIEFPETVEKVGDYAFKNCRNLKNSVLPENTIAGENVFYNEEKVTGTVMNIMPLYQFDYRRPICVFYGEEKSVATSGCGATCLSMAIGYMKGNYEQTPETLFEWAYENGYYTGDGLSHAVLSRIAARYGLTATWTKSSNDVLNALKSGKPVIAHMGHGTFAEIGHYILLRGVDENGLIVLNDPNSRERTANAYPLSEIVSELKMSAGFCILK